MRSEQLPSIPENLMSASPHHVNEQIPTVNGSQHSHQHHPANSFSQQFSNYTDANLSNQQTTSHNPASFNHHGVLSGIDIRHLPPGTINSITHHHNHATNQNLTHSQLSPLKADVSESGAHPCMPLDMQNQLLHHQHSEESYDCEQMPSGPYQPELGVSENPHYYSVNQMLYEAHIAKVRRL